MQGGLRMTDRDTTHDMTMDHVLLEDVFFFAPPEPKPVRYLAPAQIPLMEPVEERGFLAEDAFSAEMAESTVAWTSVRSTAR